MRGFHLGVMAASGVALLTQPTQADAQTVCLDHRAPGEPVNSVPCVVPDGTTLGRVESVGDGSTILIEGDVTGGVLTDGNNSGVTNNGGGGFFIATRGEDSDIVNTSNTFPFRFPDLITFGAGSDITNTGSVNEITINGDGSTINNSGNSGSVRLGSRDGVLTNTGDLAFRSFNVVNITGTNAQFLNQGMAGFTVVAGDDITIVNSGTLSEIISTPVGQNLRIENSNMIAGDIDLNNTGTVIENTGSIGGSITQEGSDFVLNNSGNIDGSVTASGANSHVTNTQSVGSFIVVEGEDARITNSGRVGAGNTGDGIEFQGDNAYLELREGSMIEGEIAFQGGGTQTLELGDLGEINYTFDGAPNQVVTTGAPYVLSGNRLAILNTTALSTQDEQLANLVGGISSVLDSRFQAQRIPSTSALTRTRPVFAFAEPQNEQTVWVDTFGSYRNQDAVGQIAENTQWVSGLVVGIDPVDVFGLETGFFIGGSRGGVDADDVSQSVDSTSFYLGSYGSTSWGNSIVDLALTVGYSEFDQERQAANNTVADGRETISANFDGWFVSPAVTMTKPTQIVGHSIEGSFGVQYAGLFLDNYTETGTTSPQTIDSRAVHVGIARLKIAAPKHKVTGDGSILNYRVQAGLEARTNFGGESIDGVLLGQDISFNTGGDNNAIGGFLNVSGEYQTQDGLILSAGTEAIFEASGSYQLSGRIGLEFRF